MPVDRDLGPYVVTIDGVEASLPPEELSAVLAQRVSRQRTMLGLALAICAWALLPLLLAGRLLFRSRFRAGENT